MSQLMLNDGYLYNKVTLENMWHRIIYCITYYDERFINKKLFNLLDEYYSDFSSFKSWDRVSDTLSSLELYKESEHISDLEYAYLNLASYFAYVQYDIADCDSFTNSADTFLSFAEDLELIQEEVYEVFKLIEKADYFTSLDGNCDSIFKIFCDAVFCWYALPWEEYIQNVKLLLSTQDSKTIRIAYVQELLEKQNGFFYTDFFKQFEDQVVLNLKAELEYYSLTKA